MATTFEGNRVTAVELREEFRTCLVWHIREREEDICAFKGAITWWLRFAADDFDTTLNGMTNNNSNGDHRPATEFHGPLRLKRYYANEYVEFQRVP